MRKAITVQFNWVFVLIAGALILFFFGSIVMKQKSLSELSASQDMVLKIGKKLGVSLTEIGKSEEIEFQGKELRITCHDLSSDKVTRSLADPVFSPEKVKGAKLITLTKAFNMPFHVTNFLYVTSSSVRYIIVYDPDHTLPDSERLARIIKEDLGDKVNSELMIRQDIGYVKDLGHYKTKIVFVKTNPLTVNLKGDVKAVHISDVDNDLEFFTGNDMNPEGDSFYLSRDLDKYRETILGAIFAENKEAYECSLKKALKKLNMMSELYIDRTYELAIRAPDCDYTSATPYSVMDYLAHIEEKSSNLLTDLNSNEINLLEDEADGLETQNINLIMASCPEIY